MRRLRLVFLALALFVSAVAVETASADPSQAKNSTPITIACGDTVYNAVVNGNGAWGPAHDLNSNSVLIPVSFGPETAVFTDPTGATSTTVSPAESKGSAAPRGATPINCSYHLGFSFPDGSSFTVDGTVTGFVTPAKA
jgi:hypothetical protein